MFKDLKIGYRIATGVGIVVTLMMFAVCASFLANMSITGKVEEVLNTDEKILESSALTRGGVRNLRRYEKDIFLNIESQEKVKEYLGKWEEFYTAASANIDKLEGFAAREEDKADVALMKKELPVYKEAFFGIIDRIKKGEIKTSQDANKAITPYKDGIHKMEETAHKLADEATKRMGTSQQDINTLVKGTSIFAGIITALALFLSMWAGYAMSRSITKPLAEINNVFEHISKGNLKTRSGVEGEDELGQMSKTLNKMLDDTLSLIQTKDERERMQRSIMKLLAEVSEVASGDLTVQAEVTPEATGAIADSFNYMVAELREIIYKVKDTTVQVGSSASTLQVTAERLAERSDLQAAQIADTSSAIGEMAASIQQVSEHAAMSANVAEQSLNSAQHGTEAVHNNIRAMNRIREQVQETAKRIKRLGERSQEISEIVQLIDDISDRTSMLALNASIQAAMAGEAGRGFAVVAEEVERLAERSTTATKQISALTKTIQSETNEVVASMEETTREVVEGSNLANEAGLALNEIEVVSKQLADLIQNISQTSKQQARGSAAISESMQEVAEVTQQTASSMKQSALTVTSLAMLADELNSSVASFKLPVNVNGNGNGNGNGHVFDGFSSSPSMN